MSGRGKGKSTEKKAISRSSKAGLTVRRMFLFETNKVAAASLTQSSNLCLKLCCDAQVFDSFKLSLCHTVHLTSIAARE